MRPLRPIAPLSIVLRRAFDIRQHNLKKRQDREREKQGLAADDDDTEASWILPEEKARLDLDKEEREVEQQERLKKHMEQRDKDDIVKRAQLKEYRTLQLARSQKLKQQRSEHKGRDGGTSSRFIETNDDPTLDEISK